MKPGLSLRTSQHLALTPQLQQSIRLLQLSTLELHQEVEQMLEQKPFLEPEDEGGFDNSLVSLTIDPEAVDPEDVEMLQDMITAAVNEALRGVADLGAQRINAATGGMSIPGLM